MIKLCYPSNSNSLFPLFVFYFLFSLLFYLRFLFISIHLKIVYHLKLYASFRLHHFSGTNFIFLQYYNSFIMATKLIVNQITLVFFQQTVILVANDLFLRNYKTSFYSKHFVSLSIESQVIDHFIWNLNILMMATIWAMRIQNYLLFQRSFLFLQSMNFFLYLVLHFNCLSFHKLSYFLFLFSWCCLTQNLCTRNLHCYVAYKNLKILVLAMNS